MTESEAFIFVDHMGLHVLSHGEGYKGVLQAKRTKIAYRYISIYNRCGSSRAKVNGLSSARVKFVVTA